MTEKQTKTINRILDDDVLRLIDNAHSEFDLGHIKETCDILEDSKFQLDRLTPVLGAMLLRQKAGYFFITGETDRCKETLVELGDLHHRAGEYEEANKAFSTARTLTPDDINLKFRIAQCVISSGDTPVGIAKLKSLIEEKSDFDPAISLLLKSSKRYRPESVISLIPDHLSRNYDDTSAHRYSIDLYEELGMKEQAVEIREKLIILLDGQNGLDSFVSESARLYPAHIQFYEKKLELSLAGENFDVVYETLEHLVTLLERKDKLEDALHYTELMLLIDLSSVKLMDKADEIRHSLGFKPTPLRCNPFPKGIDDPPDQSKLLKLDFGHVVNTLSGLINTYLYDNTDLSRSLRSTLLAKTRLRSMINTEFEGKSSTATPLWAKLQSAGKSTEKLTDLFSEQPNSKPVLRALLSSFDSNEERVALWINIATEAVKDGNPKRVYCILNLLASSCKTLAEFIPSIRPLLAESYR